MIYRIFLIFVLSASFAQSQTVSPNEKSEDNKNEIVEFPDQQAEFPGGTSELHKYIQDNIIYPKERGVCVTGRVYVKCVIDENGNVKDAVVVKGISPSHDTEALRLVSNMPTWIPAKNENKTISSIIHLPIIFSLY